MALKDTKKWINEAYFKVEAEILRDKTYETFAHVIGINYDTFGKAFAQSINESWKSTNNVNSDIVSESGIINLAENIGQAWIAKRHVPGFEKSNNVISGYDNFDMTIVMFDKSNNADNAKITDLTGEYRWQIWKEWSPDDMSVTKPGWTDMTSSGETYGKQLAIDTGISHDKETNVAKASLIQFLEESDPGTGGIFGEESLGVADAVLSRLNIKWTRDKNFLEDGDKEIWIVEGELAGDNPPWLAGTDLGEKWEGRVLKALEEAIADAADKGLEDLEGSKPFTEQATDNAVRKITKAYTKVKTAKVRGRPKKPKNSTQSGRRTATRKVKSKPKTRQIQSTFVAGKISKEKGTAGNSGETAAQLAKLRKYIQSRLPAEVRRNMGRPALMNRTGRFSNSVQLVSLVEGRNTIMAKYTYLLSPYQTFENTGKKRWPLAYNPKPLIAKSIRNLAQGRIEQRLFSRRA